MYATALIRACLCRVGGRGARFIFWKFSLVPARQQRRLDGRRRTDGHCFCLLEAPTMVPAPLSSSKNGLLQNIDYRQAAQHWKRGWIEVPAYVCHKRLNGHSRERDGHSRECGGKRAHVERWSERFTSSIWRAELFSIRNKRNWTLYPMISVII